jgi:hypothetical protein
MGYGCIAEVHLLILIDTIRHGQMSCIHIDAILMVWWAQVIKALNELVKVDKGSIQAKEIANLMYETALLTSGFDVDSPKDYAGKVYEMMSMALAVGEPGSASSSQSVSTSSGGSSSSSGAIEADQVIEEK